MKLLLEEFNK